MSSLSPRSRLRGDLILMANQSEIRRSHAMDKLLEKGSAQASKILDMHKESTLAMKEMHETNVKESARAMKELHQTNVKESARTMKEMHARMSETLADLGRRNMDHLVNILEADAEEDARYSRLLVEHALEGDTRLATMPMPTVQEGLEEEEDSKPAVHLVRSSMPRFTPRSRVRGDIREEIRGQASRSEARRNHTDVSTAHIKEISNHSIDKIADMSTAHIKEISQGIEVVSQGIEAIKEISLGAMDHLANIEQTSHPAL